MTLRGRLLVALAYILLLAIVALEVPLALSLRDRVDAEVRSQARSQADVVAATIAGNLDEPDTLDDAVETAARAVRGRVVVTDLEGALLADSAGTDRLGTDYGDRPEIAQALRNGRPVQDRRRSDTLDQEILATAVPVFDRGTRVGVVRVTQSVDAVSRATDRATLGLAAVGLLVLGLGLAAGVVIARQIAGPLRRLDAAAAQVAEGDLTVRAKVEGSAEQRSLATTFNGMTARLERLVAGQRDFVADASHQLRTPLAGLRLRLEEARAASDDPEVHEEIDAGMAELDRLAAIISELLLLSQAGEVDAPPERLDLDDAVRRAAARWDGTDGLRAGGRGRSRRAGVLPAGRPRQGARRADRERPALRRRGHHRRRAPGRRRGARPRARLRRGGARRGLRALPPRRRGPRGAVRDGARAGDRARAGAPLGRRRRARQPPRGRCGRPHHRARAAARAFSGLLTPAGLPWPRCPAA